MSGAYSSDEEAEVDQSHDEQKYASSAYDPRQQVDRGRDDHVEQGGVPRGGDWVEGPGWRMKAPVESKRRRAAEALEAKQQQESRQQKLAVQSSWRQREMDVTGPLASNRNDDAAMDPRAEEQRQFEAAVRNSLADTYKPARAAPPASPPSAAPSRPFLSEFLQRDSAHLTDSVTARGEGDTMVYWDDILDGPRGHHAVSRGAYCDGIEESDQVHRVSRGGGTGRCLNSNADDGDGLGSRFSDGILRASGGFRARAGGTTTTVGTEKKDWDAVLAEAISVVEWDLSAEIPSEALREGFRRTLLKLLKNILGKHEGRRTVRDRNTAFQENVGRWACGRRLMRLAGYVMQHAPGTEYGVAAERGTAASGGGLGYIWVAHAPRSSGHIDMLECLMGALEDQTMLGIMRTGSGSRAVDAQGVQSPLLSEDVDPVTEVAQALEMGTRLSPTAEENDFTRIRREQDMEFQDALRRDRDAAAAAKVAPMISTGDATSSNLDVPVPSVSSAPYSRDTPAANEADTGDANAGLLTIGGGSYKEGVVVASHPDQSAEERRATIAKSYAHLGLGS